MADPLREHEVTDSRIEELLLAGLDHYFNGQHELAINVWTRVLFLDRTHARARAYIERARSAIAERHREGDELLHAGLAAFARGDAGDARSLLTSAVERGARPEEAMAAARPARASRARRGTRPQAPPRVACRRGAHRATARRQCRHAAAGPGDRPGLRRFRDDGVELGTAAGGAGFLRLPRTCASPPEPLPVPSASDVASRARDVLVSQRPPARRADGARRHPPRRSAPAARRRTARHHSAETARGGARHAAGGAERAGAINAEMPEVPVLQLR